MNERPSLEELKQKLDEAVNRLQNLFTYMELLHYKYEDAKKESEEQSETTSHLSSNHD